MKRIFSLLLVGLAFTCGGCLFPFHKKSSTSHLAKIIPQLDSSKILSPKLLREAKTILIVPFTAGEQVEANRELDRLSLMIVKGFTLTFQQAAPQIKILNSEQAADADLVLRGHIIGRVKPERFKKIVMRRKDVVLKIDAEIEEPNSGRLVMKVAHQKKGRLNQDNEEVLAQKLGVDLAEFLAAQLNQP